MVRRLLKHVDWPELGRLVALFVAGTWLLYPFMNGRLIGTGDALWYANMLADFVTQWRAGIFPVFVGQTEFAFNGAVYPLRVAPLYQHLAGVVDLVTGRSLSFFALQHATVLVSGFAGLLSCYLACRRLASDRPWTACGLAILYLSCPGVLGTIYTQDLYMTWMTVPFLPFAVYGMLRTFRSDDLRSQFWLTAPLAALWFAHSPIALWMTMLVVATQLVRLTTVHRNRAAWKRAAIGGAMFAALAHYPFISVANLKVPGAASAVTAGLTEQERITNAIREVFPAVLRPVSANAGALSDLQLGYALWTAWLALLLVALRKATALELRLLAGATLLLLVLLLPVPGVTDWLWANLPEQIKRITFYWPMHRFYLLLAALLTGAGALILTTASSQRTRQIIGTLLVVACTWSLWESRQFVRAGRIRTSTTEATSRFHRPENLLLMNHAYGLFAALPAYFSNGVMDPRAEVRLLDATGAPFPPQRSKEPSPARWFKGVVDANPGILKLSPSLRLEPGKRYELAFAFPDREIHGVLQLAGGSFFREYVLPESGQPRAFGSKPGSAHTLSLWTTSTMAEEITLRFIPLGSGAKPADFVDFAQFHFVEVTANATPLEVTSLMPLRVVINAPAGVVALETPRMLIPGYEAEIAGQEIPVTRSIQGLATIAVPEGRSEVILTYHAPLSVKLSYWAVVFAWMLLLPTTAFALWRRGVWLNPN